MESVYILHGWSQDKHNKEKWQHFIKELQQKGIDSVFLKLPGLSTDLSEVWTLGHYVKWLEKQLPQKNQVILVGHSFGGQIASRFSALYPQRIKKLILIDSSGIRNNSLPIRLKRGLFLILAKTGKLLCKGEIFRTLLYKLAREDDYRKASPLLRQTMTNVVREEVINDLPNISCPTCIIWGEQDQVTPLFMAKAFKRLIPDNQLHIIPTARHSPQFTHTTKVADIINHFIFS